MSSSNLTRVEASQRAQAVEVLSELIEIDVTGAPSKDTHFPVDATLELAVKDAGTKLWIDFLGGQVDQVSVDGAVVDFTYDGSRIWLGQLSVGEHQVRVCAQGRFSNTGQGLHRFKDPVDGATYLYTHFEPSDARRAWPCMDQPDLKTVFTLVVKAPLAWTVLANGLPVQTRENDDYKLIRFSPTKPLSTYLSALAAGPYHRVCDTWTSRLHDEQGAPLEAGAHPLTVPLSWACRASLAKHLDADELLQITKQGLDYFDATYDFAYPWGSYDCVLVPEYNIGAMENPGCVTFSEDAYLFQGEATADRHASRANTMLHEMSHMWFGDLVTPRWWEDTWLKESFADHQGTEAAALATKYTDQWVAFASRRKAWAYNEDQRVDTTHPIEARVDDVEAARQTFDGITYAKGASVLKQLVAYVGHERFVQAARIWFKRYAFSNADLTQFLQVLSEASGQDMSAWESAWLRTAGPSIITDEIEIEDGRISRLTVSQHSVDLATGQQILRPHTLNVGLYYLRNGKLEREHLLPLTLSESSTQLDEAVGLAAPQMVLVNDEDLTYAVVRPDALSLETASTHLARLGDPLARALWWSMLYNLARDGLLSAKRFIEIALAQADDKTELATLTNLFTQAQTLALYYSANSQADVQLLAQGLTSRLDQARPGSPAQTVLAKAYVSVLGQLGTSDKEVSAQGAKQLQQLFDGHFTDLEISTELRWRTLISLARLDAVSDTDLAVQLARENTATTITYHLQAAKSRPNAVAKREVFTRLLGEDTLSNDHIDALVGAFNVPSHRQLTLPFAPEYFAALEQIWASRSQEIASRLVNGLYPHAGGEAELALSQAWLDEHPQAPAALRRLVLKAHDDLARAVRARH